MRFAVMQLMTSGALIDFTTLLCLFRLVSRGHCSMSSPWMQTIAAEGLKACGQYGMKIKICMPDHQAILSALESAEIDVNSAEFQADLHVVIDQYLQWPPAYPGIPIILHKSRRWMPAYCKVFFNNWSQRENWQWILLGNPFERPRHTLDELRRIRPGQAAQWDLWLQQLRQSKDREMQQLIQDLDQKELSATEDGFHSYRPLQKVLQHLRAEAITHILFKACRKNKHAKRLLDFRDLLGRNIVHFLASAGNLAMLQSLMSSMGKRQWTRLLSSADEAGRTAVEWALTSGYTDTVAFLKNEMAVVQSLPRPLPEPITLFPSLHDSVEQCSTNSIGLSGGWKQPDADSLAAVVPEHWMSPTMADRSCFADTIDVSQFDWDVFKNHYIWSGRPLLIRNGAQMPATVAKHYSRAGLLEVAGQRVINTFAIPYADKHLSQAPVGRRLRDYLQYLDARPTSGVAETLDYVFLDVDNSDIELSFAHVMPNLIADKVPRRNSQFYVGGMLMGSPLHYHNRAVNSLMYGRKLWFLKPPAEMVWSNEVMYSHLLRTNGSPGSHRCIQQAGDLFFVPKDWAHGAICLADCIGVAHEFDPPQL